MDVFGSRGSRAPSSSRKKQARRVDNSPDDEQYVDSEAEPSVSDSRRTPKSSTRTLSSLHNGVEDENDENANPASNATPMSSNSIHGKRRRLSASGRAAAVATPTQGDYSENDGGNEDEEEDATPPPPGTSGNAFAGPGGSPAQDHEVDPLMDEEFAEVKQESKKAVMKKQLLARDPDDGYVMGSIVRIKCHNFLTYFDIECHPGPHLNMIFGPNGSGKSSLVAAMALGLGFPPKVMARTKALRKYVKEGTDEGFVEIELKGRPGKRNLVVRRSLSAQNDQSVFEINGKVATKAKVAENVKHLNVNINNLCSFLPQDRVSDFAKMSGDELLRETQRTADEELLLIQTELTELKNKLSTADTTMEKNRTQLIEQERKMQGLERDVRRHKERQAVEDALLLEEVCLPYAQYQEAKVAHEQSKREKNEIKERMDGLADDNRPLMEQKDALKSLMREADARRKALSKQRDEIMRAQKKAVETVARVENNVEDLRNEIKEIKKEELSRKRKIDDRQKEIRSLEKDCKNGPPQEVSIEVGERSRQLRDEMFELSSQIRDLASQHEAFTRAIDSANEEKVRIQNQLQALNDVQRRREDLCRKEDEALFTALEWTRRNQRVLKCTVYDPIRVLVSVKDKRHARVAEAAINYNFMKTFVCLEQDDYTLLADTFVKFKANNYPDAPVRDLRVNLAHLPKEQRDLALYERPCTQQQLQSLGFDAFVIDLLEGPPDVLAYLCVAANLHRIPVAFGDGRGVAHDRLRQPNSPFRRYITSTTVTDIQFSRYGNRGAVVQDVQTRDPRLFAESVDQNRKRELDLRLAEADAAKQEAQKGRDELAQMDTDLRTRHDELKAERVALDAERKRIDDAKRAYAALKIKLRDAQAHLVNLQQQPNADARRKELADKMKKLSLTRIRISRSLEGNSASLVRCHALEARPLFAQLEAAASLQVLETTLRTRSEEQAAVIRSFEEITARVQEYKTLARQIFKQAEEGQTRIPERLDDSFKEKIANLEGEPADAIAQRVQDLQGELELSQQINHGVIQKYEDLKASVERLRHDISKQENSVRSAREKIERLHAKWHPRVKDIVETVGRKFSSAMQSLGCLGEVSIKEDEDYAKWAICIQVAFRDGEKLAELTSHRQSGGERSLTTMMYLISLLQMSKVPFSLVDEINQGMDARAERAVHNHLVKAVCEVPDVGQYFLLTPKLLTNLYYHPNIKVLCVFNGEWLPDDGLPIRALISKKLDAIRQRKRAN